MPRRAREWNVPGKVQSAYPARTARAALIGRIFVLPASTQPTALFLFFSQSDSSERELRGRVERSMTRTKLSSNTERKEHRGNSRSICSKQLASVASARSHRRSRRKARASPARPSEPLNARRREKRAIRPVPIFEHVLLGCDALVDGDAPRPRVFDAPSDRPADGATSSPSPRGRARARVRRVRGVRPDGRGQGPQVLPRRRQGRRG